MFNETINTNIPTVLVRGDTKDIRVVFTSDGLNVTPNGMLPDDTLSFSICKKGSSQAAFTVTTTVSDGLFKITHENTKDLKPGKYEYDIEFRKEDMSVVKTLQLGEIEVKKDITI